MPHRVFIQLIAKLSLKTLLKEESETLQTAVFFYFLEACLSETSFHIGVKIGAAFPLKKKKKKQKPECKISKDPKQVPPPPFPPRQGT